MIGECNKLGLFERFSLLIYVFIYAGEANYYLFGWVLGVGTGMFQERLHRAMALYKKPLRVRMGRLCVLGFKCFLVFLTGSLSIRGVFQGCFLS